MLQVTTKICTKCEVEKSTTEFYKATRRKDGKSPWCKTCHSVANKTNDTRPEVKARRALLMKAKRSDPEFRKRENERLRKYRGSNSAFKAGQKKYWERYYSDPANVLARKERGRKLKTAVEVRAQRLLSGAKQRDPNCTMTLEHVLTGVRRGHCPVTGIAFDLGSDHQRRTGHSRNPFSPSIDRIDSRLGYTNENTRVVITHYNFMKGQLTDEEMKFICKQVVEFAP